MKASPRKLIIATAFIALFSLVAAAQEPYIDGAAAEIEADGVLEGGGGEHRLHGGDGVDVGGELLGGHGEEDAAVGRELAGETLPPSASE